MLPVVSQNTRSHPDDKYPEIQIWFMIHDAWCLIYAIAIAAAVNKILLHKHKLIQFQFQTQDSHVTHTHRNCNISILSSISISIYRISFMVRYSTHAKRPNNERGNVVRWIRMLKSKLLTIIKLAIEHVVVRRLQAQKYETPLVMTVLLGGWLSPKWMVEIELFEGFDAWQTETKPEPLYHHISLAWHLNLQSVTVTCLFWILFHH